MKLIKIILWDFLNLRLNLGSYRLLIGLSLRFFFTKQYFENGGTLVKYNNYFALLQKQFSLVVLDEFPRKVAMSYLESIRPYFSSYYILNVLASFLYVLLKTLHPICEWFFKEGERCELTWVCLFIKKHFFLLVQLVLFLNEAFLLADNG